MSDRVFNPPQYYWEIADEYIEQKYNELHNTKYCLDTKIAKKYIKFASILKHTAGEYAGVNFQFQDWQIHSIVDIFATKYRDGKFKGLRRYQRVLFFMSKKNGKSEFGGLFHALMFFLDSEKAKESYSIATESEQAKIIHKVFLTMIKQEPELEEMIKSTVKPPRITKYQGAFEDEFQSLSSSVDTKDGLRPSFLTVDEGHAHKSKDLYQIMSDGLAGRQEPLEIHLSTAGYNKEGFFFRDIYTYAKKIKDGIIKDDRFYYVLFEPDQEDIDNDDWENPEVWKKANPNLGNSPTWSYMEGKVAQARESEESLIAFKTKHLNMWCDKAETWIPHDIWTNDETFNLEDFKGCQAYYGVDLSSTTDITNLTVMFIKEDKLYVHQKYYIPSENVRKRAKVDRVPYLDWIKEGYITTTEGNVVDYEYIERDILKLREDYEIDFLGYDTWNSNYLMTRLEKQGVETVAIRQGFQTLSPASKELEVKAIQKNIIHNNNPVLNWCISNVVLEKDAADNIKPSKKKSIEKIDGVAGLINCMALYILNKEEESTESHYESNGLIDL
jgi:phage terminase large subunit-like protein